MEISSLSIKIILLLVPGALATLITERLTLRPRHYTPFRFVISSILYGITSYLALQVIYFCFICAVYPDKNTTLEVFQAFNKDTSIPAGEIFFASLLAISLSMVVIRLTHTKTLYRLASKYGISKKFGDENLFLYFNNSPDVEWVYIRRQDTGFTYLGAIESYGEEGNSNEIVLADVTVYEYETSYELYRLDKMYMSLSKADTTIELANVKPANTLDDGNEEDT